MVQDDLEIIQIVESDIIDSTIEVGSACIWRGSGKEPQWDNPKSTKAYDHIIRHHGFKLKSNNLFGRAASKKRDQGQWLNDRDWVIAEKSIPNYYGQYIIRFKRPIGRVYHPDGKITQNVEYVKIGRNPDGTIKYAYPVVSPQKSLNKTEVSENESKQSF